MEQSNQTGELGEALASKLMPSATLAPDRNKGFDMWDLAGNLVEVKCSRYIKKLNGWRFRVKPAQVEACDWLLLLALSPEDTLISYWMIPGQEIRSKQIIINEFNLRDYQKYLVEVLTMENNHTQTRAEKRRKYQHEYYLAHREELIKKHKEYYETHPTPKLSLEYRRDYWHAHKDQYNRARRLRWQAAHPIAQRVRRVD